MDNHKVKIEEIIKAAKQQNPKMTVEQEQLIQGAYSFALLAHRGQKRLSGDDYIISVQPLIK